MCFLDDRNPYYINETVAAFINGVITRAYVCYQEHLQMRNLINGTDYAPLPRAEFHRSIVIACSEFDEWRQRSEIRQLSIRVNAERQEKLDKANMAFLKATLGIEPETITDSDGVPSTMALVMEIDSQYELINQRANGNRETL